MRSAISQARFVSLGALRTLTKYRIAISKKYLPRTCFSGRSLCDLVHSQNARKTATYARLSRERSGSCIDKLLFSTKRVNSETSNFEYSF